MLRAGPVIVLLLFMAVAGVLVALALPAPASASYSDGGFTCANIPANQWCWDDGPWGGYETWDHSPPHGYHNWVRTQVQSQAPWNDTTSWQGIWPYECHGSTSCGANTFAGPFHLNTYQAVVECYGGTAALNPWLAEVGQSNHSAATVWGYADDIFSC